MKSKDEDDILEDLAKDEISEDLLEDEILEDDILDNFDEEVMETIVKIPLPSALIKMQNGIDLRIKGLKTKFTKVDILSELYLDILE